MKLCHWYGVRLQFLALIIFGTNPTVAYTADPRWGQAVVIINDALFIHGGKTDQYNAYSYTSAPNTNDLLFLSLSDAFEASNPPWILVSSSTDSSTSQGPAISWHTLSAYNTSAVLLFGGQPGPNSPVVIADLADSVFTLNVYNHLHPVWEQESLEWAGQPTRRIYHCAVTSSSGIVYIIGGLTPDGSGHAFSEHYAYNPDATLFSQLSSENAPPAIYGHASIVLPDGRVIIFGGVLDGSLLPFSTIWVLDTTKNPPVWSTLLVDVSSLPPPRRAFVAVKINEGQILIHGGSDAELQTTFADGWILDTTTNPATWTHVEALSQLGPRRDHLAIVSNGQVIFGFGYSNSGPAPAGLQIFDPSSGSFLPSYTPPPATAIITQTLPQPTQTTSASGGMTKPTDHTGSATGTKTAGGVVPTKTGGEEPGTGEDNREETPVMAIILGTTLGILGAIVIAMGVVALSRRLHRRQPGQGAFTAIRDDDDGGNSSIHAGPPIPVATMHDEKSLPGWAPGGFLGAAFGLVGTIGAAVKSRNNNTYQRRDMLADEDMNDFGEWYQSQRRRGSTGSSWSLMNVVGGRFRSREPSTFSQHTGGSHRHERTDPFSDEASLMRDEELGSPGIESVTQPPSRRGASYFSTKSGHNYFDPFSDPVKKEQGTKEEKDIGEYHDDNEYEPTATVSNHLLSSLPTIRTVPPVAVASHPLSPLSEHPSKTSLGLSATSHSNENPLYDTSSSPVTSSEQHSPFASLSRSTSQSPPSSTSLISTTPANVRRSDSWWTKFYNAGFLDRKSSSAARRAPLPNIRDPNPPPTSTLGPIHESSGSGDTPSVHTAAQNAQNTGQSSRSNTKVYATGHNKSVTSVRTEDTERIERMAGTMDVAQRVFGSHRHSFSSGISVDTRQSTYDRRELALVTPGEIVPGGVGGYQISPSPSLNRRASLSGRIPAGNPDSNVGTSQPSPLPVSFFNKTSPSGFGNRGSSHGTPLSPASPTSVAERIKSFEWRLSLDQEQAPPTNTKKREERSGKRGNVSIDYGLVPRASLFIANPDHRLSSSGDS